MRTQCQTRRHASRQAARHPGGSVLLGAAAALLTALLAACGGGAGASGPSWQGQPADIGESPGVHITPIVPLPELSPGSSGNSSSGPPGAPPNRHGSSTPAKGDPNVLAKHLIAPIGLTFLPDGSALVGERTTGKIVHVQPVPNQPVPTVKTLTGLDTSGDGGLLDLALSPAYPEDDLIYAYITTPADNRVVEFTLKGPVTPVLTGIPKGRTDNTGRIMFGADGDLYIGTGDAGRPALAANPNSLAGKVLRVTDIGQPAPGNPTAGSPVYTSGHRVVNGLCAVPQTNAVFEVEGGSATVPDEVNLLHAGDNYGWPTPTSTSEGPSATLPRTGRNPGGCTVLNGTIYVTSLDGQELLGAPLQGQGADPRPGDFSPTLQHTYGRLRTVVAAADGALWLTTSNRDGFGKPVPDDERVIRIVPSGGGGANSPA